MNERIEYLQKKARELTTSPGVYLMKDRTGKVIYVGKAKVLTNRVRSYFRTGAKHDEKVRKMVENVYDFDYIVTDSEFEALVLECSLIKQYNPKYNIFTNKTIYNLKYYLFFTYLQSFSFKSGVKIVTFLLYST